MFVILGQGSVERSNTTQLNIPLLHGWGTTIPPNGAMASCLHSSLWIQSSTKQYHYKQYHYKTIPYKALFGIRPRIGLRTELSAELLVNVKTGIQEKMYLDVFRGDAEKQSNEEVQEQSNEETHPVSRNGRQNIIKQANKMIPCKYYWSNTSD